jgi:hypothetical protein
MAASLSKQIAAAVPRTVFRFKDAAGKHYSAVKLSESQLLEVKRAGAKVCVSHADPAAWLQTIPMGPVGMSTEPPALSLSGAERQRRREEVRLRREKMPMPPVGGSDVEVMMGILRRAKVKRGFALLYPSYSEDLAIVDEYLEGVKGVVSNDYLTNQIHAWNREKQRLEGYIRANPDDQRITSRYLVSWAAPRLFVVHEDGMKLISLCLLKMAGNHPYEFDNQSMIIYDGCVGRTFAEAGVPLDEDGRPNIWYIPAGTKKDPKKVVFA